MFRNSPRSGSSLCESRRVRHLLFALPCLTRGRPRPSFKFSRLYGTNVADFRLYSADVIAEVLLFIDDLGMPLADYLQLPREAWENRSAYHGDFTDLIGALREISAALG